MKNLRTFIIIALVAGLGYMAYKLANKPTGSKMASEALSDFAIKDTASIDKLILTDTDGNEGVSLTRQADNKWTMESGDCVQQHLVGTILETIKYIRVKSPVPKGAIENTNKNIASHHTKVEIFQNGKLAKTWYVGSPTQDQYGTYMLLSDPEKGKSPEPFITYLPSMYGSLSSRFITDPLMFECTGVFNYAPENIASVDVVVPDSTELNYKIVAEGDNLFSMYNNENKVAGFDTVRVRSYLVFFRKIHFESHNYSLNEEQTDSLKQTQPYYQIAVTDKDGETNQIKLFKRKYFVERIGLDGEPLEYDQDRAWVELDDGTLVVGQYHVFGKLLRDIHFFETPDNTQIPG